MCSAVPHGDTAPGSAPRDTPPRDTAPRDTAPRDTPPRDTPPGIGGGGLADRWQTGWVMPAFPAHVGAGPAFPAADLVDSAPAISSRRAWGASGMAPPAGEAAVRTGRALA